MAVAVTTLIRPTQGQQEQHQHGLKQTLQHLQRMGGARTHVLQALIAGANTGVIGLAVEFDDMTAFGRWNQQSAQDSAWQQHLSTGAAVATGAGSLVGRVLYAELGTSTGLQSHGAGGVMVTTQLQVATGKQAEAQQFLGQVRGRIEQLGGQVSNWQTTIGGPATGLLLVVVQVPNMSAYAQLSDKLRTDQEYQQLLTQAGSAASPVTLTGRSLWTELSL